MSDGETNSDEGASHAEDVNAFIIAEAPPHPADGLPTITYISCGLEKLTLKSSLRHS